MINNLCSGLQTIDTSVEIQEWVKLIFPVSFFIPISATILEFVTSFCNMRDRLAIQRPYPF